MEGALAGRPVRQVAAGLNLTLAVTVDGCVWQMGKTAPSHKGSSPPWEGCSSPVQVSRLADFMHTVMHIRSKPAPSKSADYMKATSVSLGYRTCHMLRNAPAFMQSWSAWQRLICRQLHVRRLQDRTVSLKLLCAQVLGALADHQVESVSAGLSHVAALAGPIDPRFGNTQVGL